jgi:phage terminase large subunit-like protein
VKRKVSNDPLRGSRKSQLHTQVVFDIHEVLNQKAKVLREQGLEACETALVAPKKVNFHSIHLGEIDVALQLNEKRRSNEQQILKIKFKSQMQFIKPAETKKMKGKNFHLYIFEEIPLFTGQSGANAV